MLIEISKKYFSYADQIFFSLISGDTNPIHIDRSYAKSTKLKDVNLYGGYVILWILDVLASKGIVVKSFNIHFLKPILIEKMVSMWCDDINNIVHIICEGDKCFVFKYIKNNKGFNLPVTDYYRNIHFAEMDQQKPNFLSFDDCLKFNKSKYGVKKTNFVFNIFDDIKLHYSHSIIDEISTISGIIGNKCPGLYSIETSFKLEFKHKNSLSYPHFSVIKNDDRFGMITIEFNSLSFVAYVETLYRDF